MNPISYIFAQLLYILTYISIAIDCVNSLNGHQALTKREKEEKKKKNPKCNDLAKF